MKKLWISTALAVLGFLTLTGSVGKAQDEGERELRAAARLTGFQEVTPKVSRGRGLFRARITREGIEYELRYTGLSAPATASHIQLAQPGVKGGIFVFLCGGGGRPTCPGTEGTVRGKITPDDVMAIPDQGLEAGDLAAVVHAMRFGSTYVNIHTSTWPGGEIRGQVRARPVRQGEDEENQDNDRQ